MTKIIMENHGPTDKNYKKEGKEKTKRPFCFKGNHGHRKASSSRNPNLYYSTNY